MGNYVAVWKKEFDPMRGIIEIPFIGKVEKIEYTSLGYFVTLDDARIACGNEAKKIKGGKVRLLVDSLEISSPEVENEHLKRI